jgi:DNA-binding transcriptional ArsR family regulator
MKVEGYVEIFKALSHPIRLKIVCGLMRKEDCNVGVMSEKLAVPQPTISQHLNILKNANIIAGYRNGNQICYKLENSIVKKIINCLEVKVCEL